MTPAALRSLSARFAAAAEPLDVALWREALDALYEAGLINAKLYNRAANLIKEAYALEDPNLLLPVALSWLPEGSRPNWPWWTIRSVNPNSPRGFGAEIWMSNDSSGAITARAKSPANALAAAICAALAELKEKDDATS